MILLSCVREQIYNAWYSRECSYSILDKIVVILDANINYLSLELHVWMSVWFRSEQGMCWNDFDVCGVQSEMRITFL